MEKRPLGLQSFVHRFITLCFLFVSLFLLVVIAIDVFTEDGKIKRISTDLHHSKGYALPIDIVISIPDSVVSYQGCGYNRKANYFREFDEIANINQEIRENAIRAGATKSVITNKINAFTSQGDSFDVYPQIRTKGRVIGKSSNKIVLTLQAIYNYLPLIMLMLVLYQLMRVLERRLVFSTLLVRRVKIIGSILVISELIQVIILLCIQGSYPMIHISSLKDGSFIDVAYQLNFSRSLDFDLTLFIVGICLLLLGSLLKCGHTLQKENELTI